MCNPLTNVEEFIFWLLSMFFVLWAYFTCFETAGLEKMLLSYGKVDGNCPQSITHLVHLLCYFPEILNL
jgi:hypothetical protein